MRSVLEPGTNERGAVAVLVAMALLLLMGVAAVAVDGGMAYDERRTTQNAADNAALAGAWELCASGDESRAAEAALENAEANGYRPPDVDEPEVEDETVTVRIRSEIGTGFGRTQGVTELGVESEARARCVPGGGGGGMLSHAALISTGSCAPTRVLNNIKVEGFVYSASDLIIENNAEIDGPVYTEGDLTVENNAVVRGAVHTNGDLTVKNNAKHLGSSDATYVGKLDKKNNASTWNPKKVAPREPLVIEEPYSAADYAPGSPAAIAAESRGEYHYYPGDLDLKNNVHLDPGIYYVKGDVTLKNNVKGSNITIIAEGRIDIKNNIDLPTPYVEGLVLMSTAGDGGCGGSPAIDVDNNSFIGGTVYAPNGKVDMGNNGALPGAVIGVNVSLKNNFRLLGDTQAWNGGVPKAVLES